MRSEKAEQIRADVYEKLGQVALTLGAPVRLKLIQLLSQAPRTVEELSQSSHQSIANTSQHLQKLAHAGLVTVRRQGVKRVYSLKSPSVALVWERLQDLAGELHPELSRSEDLLTDLSLRAPVSAKAALSQVRQGKATLLDVREAREAEATPVADSVAIPLRQLKVARDKLPKNRPVYVFCRGRFCPLASDAVRILRAEGYRAYRLREGAIPLNRVGEDQ